MKLLIVFSIFILALPSFANKKQSGAVLPELRIESGNEDENQKKALKSEILISKTENQAINALVAALKKSKGTPQEAEMWFRLAELYMRRAKSGRFFDLYREGSDAARFAPPEIREESSVASLKRAIQVYTKIEREFPKFREMDSVLFNNAFASQQIGLKKNAEALYLKVVDNHTKSPLVPDAQLALGEMKYEQQRFESALEHFSAIEKFPKSKVFSYGLYKSAWTLYNLHKNEEAIDKLVQVVKFHDPENSNGRKVNHNLRAEALRDLTVFYGEKYSASEVYAFFSKLCNSEELGDLMVQMGKMYLSHSKQAEMNTFLSEFIKRNPASKNRMKAHLLLIESYESVRDRKSVLSELQAASEVCAPTSSWVAQNPQSADEACNYDLPKSNVEVAKRWWELWQKNKQSKDAKELAQLTQQVFKLHLARENPAKPDTKSRYAYAELLFQLDDFRNASKQYENVSLKSQDTTIKHDAAYSALVALQKASEKSKESEDQIELVRLSKAYLSAHPQGPHAYQVTFKVGFIAYEQENFTEAEPILRKLATDPKSGEFKLKSEDLILDILNARKDFGGIRTFASEVDKQTTDPERKKKLKTLMEQSEYAEIQVVAKDGKQKEAADRLVVFARTNITSPLAKDSLWQALSLFYASGYVIDGADLALEYVETYPGDSKSLNALIDAAKHYTESGFLLKAATTMDDIAQRSEKDRRQYTEAASELYLLEGKVKESQATLKRLLTGEKQYDGRIYSKILATLKGKEKSPEYQDLENKIASLGVEPFASQVRIRKVETLFEQKKWTEAFNAAKPLVSQERGMDDDIRARARLVQAKVLEREFIDTRTKTNIEKLSLILSIKTEKLDKAQTAFLASAKIAKDPNTQLQALMGLSRIYGNYVDSVGHPIIKNDHELTEDDKKALATELAKLTSPILEKKIEIDKRLQNLAKERKAASSDAVAWLEVPAEETVKARIRPVDPSWFKPLLPLVSAKAIENGRFEGQKGITCSLSKEEKALDIATLSMKASQCVLLKNANLTEKIGFEISRKDPGSPLGTFYLSLAADLEASYDKAIYLVESALKKSKEAPFLVFQKARLLYKSGDAAGANTAFIKADELGLKSQESTLVSGIVAYAQGDCFTVLEKFQTLQSSQIKDLQLTPAMSECLAQKGEFDKALLFAEQNIKGSLNPAELYIQMGHIHESFRFDSGKALQSYSQALKVSTDSEMKDWLGRKIDWLKGQAPTTTQSAN
ncbi:MAG: tetratricopeptide repeat protein [Pseudobdellovibrionaceae bacterium]